MRHSVHVQLGKTIQDRRLALRLSVNDAAESIGIAPDLWQNYEDASEMIPVGRLIMMANVLDTHPYELFVEHVVKPGAFARSAFEVFYLWRSIQDSEKRKQLLDMAREMAG